MTAEQEKDAIESIELAMETRSATARKAVKKLLDKLIAHRDSTVGLWATDLPGMVNDPKKVMFEIKF